MRAGEGRTNRAEFRVGALTFNPRSPNGELVMTHADSASALRTSRSDHTPPYPSADEVESVLARVRAERRQGPVNTTSRWQVRIGWTGSAKLPPFSFDVRDSREEAEYCARHVMLWKQADDGLCVTGTWVREPGASEWEPVTSPQVAAS